MGSVGNQNPLAPYDNYKDCSLGICSIYCTQFCYIFFPPPPPPSDDDSSTPFSPLIIAIIGVLASAFLLVSYYTIVTRYCKRRGSDHTTGETIENHDETPRDQWQVASTGLDEAIIKTIAVCQYRKGEGLIDESDCAVCLSEFQENESLRLLPKCSHAFHLPCIDTWLKSHSSCPLCRANVVAIAQPSAPPPPDRTPSGGNVVSSYVVQRPNDLVIVVDDDQERNNCDQHVVISLVNDGYDRDRGNVEDSEVIRGESNGLRDEEGVKEFRRSISLGTFSSRRQLLISDILKIEDVDEDLKVTKDESWSGIGSSKGLSDDNSRELGLLRSPVAMQRSNSISRFIKGHDKGKDSILPK